MTCKDCIHSGLCYKENDYENFPDRCGRFISDKVLEERPQGKWRKIGEEYYNWSNHDVIKCSLCGYVKNVPDLEMAPHFCEGCGSAMMGTKNDK